MEKEDRLTRSDLRKRTGAPGYIIDYLQDCGRLPITRESQGPGYPRLYSPGAVEIIKAHIRRNQGPRQESAEIQS